jgi:hypothetical protein
MIASCSKCQFGGLILGILLVVGAPGRVGADPPRAFSGQLVSRMIPGTEVTRNGVASSLRVLLGELTPFGPVSGIIQQNVDLTTLPPQFVGYFALESRGGLIFGYVTGQLIPKDPTFQNFYVIEQVHLTGGTGRWSGLSGTGTGMGIASADGTSMETDSGTFTTGNH